MVRAIPLPAALTAALALAAGVGACNVTTGPTMLHTTTSTTPQVPTTIDAPVIAPDSFVTLKNAADAHDELCTPDDQHPNFPNDADLVTAKFCQDLVPGGVMPTPHSLADLQALFGLTFADKTAGNGTNGNPAFAILAHSSALTARKVSTITPTSFMFTPPPADGSAPKGQYVALAFDPGEQFVEVAAMDATVNNVNFYVIFFDQACTTAAGGCTPTDLLTPKLVTGWSNLRVYEDTTSLGNTIFDCHVCHQPDNNAAPFLRMQEIETPFTHWFSSSKGGQALLTDFQAAHGTTEDYGGIPAALIPASDPSKLAALVTQAGFGTQPNVFPSAQVEKEVCASSAAQPGLNTPIGVSPAWQAIYDNSALGNFIATPYHDVKVTDPAKLGTMTTAYQQWMRGALTALPDIRDVFLDEGLRDMGFAPKVGATGLELLQQECQECHNSKLDMTQSRENFLVDKLDTMSSDEKKLAITRLQDPVSTRLRMPPVLYRTITDAERQSMIFALEQ